VTEVEKSVPVARLHEIPEGVRGGENAQAGDFSPTNPAPSAANGPNKSKVAYEIPDDLSIPFGLRRQPQPQPEPRKDGPWAGSYLSDDDIEDIESGKFK
jgi:hypothetical protein